MPRMTDSFYWMGETLRANDFGEDVEILSADWSGEDEFEAEHKALLAAAHDLQEAVSAVLHDCSDILPEYYFQLLAAAKEKSLRITP